MYVCLYSTFRKLPEAYPTLEHVTETLEMGKRQDSLKVGMCWMIFGVTMKTRGHASVCVVHTVSHQTPEEHRTIIQLFVIRLDSRKF